MLKLDSKESDLAEDYKTKVIPQIASSETEDFDYIFFTTKTCSKNYLKNIKIINKNNKVLILKNM